MKFLVAALMLIAGTWFTPWSSPRGTITVTGEAKEQIANQMARFNVNVTQTNKDKDTAVEAVNREMGEIIKAVKDFGIADKDLTTQNVSVYEIDQPEILIYPPRPRSGEKEWQASNSLEIILRDVNQASVLTDLLQGFPLAQVSGPNLDLDDTRAAEADVSVQAVQDARDKAEKIAAAAKRKLGKVIRVSEGDANQPLPVLERATSAAPIEAGSFELSKTVTVVFELK